MPSLINLQMPVVSFQNADSKPVLKGKTNLKRFITSLFQQYRKSLHSLTIIFCTDEYLLSLNNVFLQHDYYTDILTFDLSESTNIAGEIYISTERVKENALSHNVSFQNELLRVIFHGVLHLCGFTDITRPQKRKMTAHENNALQQFAKFHVKQE